MDPNSGDGRAFEIIEALGKIIWTVGGVLFLVVIDMSLKLLGMSLFVVFAVKGGVILFAAIIDAMRQRIRLRG